jgi:hypothetical protein
MSTKVTAAELTTSSPRLKDAVILISIFVLGAICSWQFRLPWVIANFLLLCFPLAYLLLTSEAARTRVNPKFTILFIVFATVAFDFMCERYDGWTGPTVFPFRLPGRVTIEEVQWIAFYFPLMFAVNEHFFATRKRTPPNHTARSILKSFFYLALLLVIFTAFFVNLFAYVYMYVGLILQPFFILLGIWVNRRVLREVLLMGIVSGLLNLIFEFIALRNHYWEFPGAYLGNVRLFDFVFPVEELLFLILMSGPSIISTYAIYKNWKQI